MAFLDFKQLRMFIDRKIFFKGNKNDIEKFNSIQKVLISSFNNRFLLQKEIMTSQKVIDMRRINLFLMGRSTRPSEKVEV